MSCVGRQPELGPEHRHRGAQHVERGTAARERGQQRAEAGGHGAPLPHLFGEGRRGCRVGEVAPEQQVPDVFERARLRQVDGRVLPVVEEALLPTDVADGRLGHHDAFEAGAARPRSSRRPVGCGPRPSGRAATRRRCSDPLRPPGGGGSGGRSGWPMPRRRARRDRARRAARSSTGAPAPGRGNPPRRSPAGGHVRSGCRRPCPRRSPRPSRCRPRRIVRAATSRLTSAPHVTAGEVMRSRTMVSMASTMTPLPCGCKR